MHDDLRAIVDFFVQQMQLGRPIDEVVQWINEQMPDYSKDLGMVLPIVREVRIYASRAKLRAGKSYSESSGVTEVGETKASNTRYCSTKARLSNFGLWDKLLAPGKSSASTGKL